MDISFEAPFHTFTSYEKIENMEFYNQFLNWLKGEFDLYLMEEKEGLKVHFPSGLFSISLFSESEKKLAIEIKIFSKRLKTANQISAKIQTLYNHLKTI